LLRALDSSAVNAPPAHTIATAESTHRLGVRDGRDLHVHDAALHDRHGIASRSRTALPSLRFQRLSSPGDSIELTLVYSFMTPLFHQRRAVSSFPVGVAVIAPPAL